MFMSIFGRNGHVEALRCTAVVLLAGCGIDSASAVQPKSESNPGAFRASAEEARRASPLILAAFKDQSDMPDATVFVAEPFISPHWSSTRDDRRLLAPVNVHYSGLTNSYCRLVTLTADLRSSELVPLPSSVNADECAGVSSVVYLDINDDGLPDVVHGMSVKSHRYDAYVVVPVVYLSSDRAKSGYCYSDQASRQLAPKDLISNITVKVAIETARRRLANPLFSCSP